MNLGFGLGSTNIAVGLQRCSPVAPSPSLRLRPFQVPQLRRNGRNETDHDGTTRKAGSRCFAGMLGKHSTSLKSLFPVTRLRFPAPPQSRPLSKFGERFFFVRRAAMRLHRASASRVSCEALAQTGHHSRRCGRRTSSHEFIQDPRWRQVEAHRRRAGEDQPYAPLQFLSCPARSFRRHALPSNPQRRSPPAATSAMTYRVRPGDTVSSIAKGCT